MKKRLFALCAGIIAGLLALQPLASETKMTVDVTPGKNWESTTWIVVYPMKHAPQLAVWIEDADGNFVKTITVTGSSAKNKWVGNPTNGRPESLPVWKHKANPGAGVVDAASSATPKEKITLDRPADDLVAGREYTVFLEVNSSFDYNAAWPKHAKKGQPGYSGVNGQPSLVYAARFVAGAPLSVALVPLGTGSVDGSNGSIRPGVDGLTTALTMIDHVTFEIK